MSNVERFQELLRSDEALQERLRTAAAAYEGDRADEAAVFAAVIAPLAAEVGLPFTFEEAGNLACEEGELSLDDVDAAAGGEDVPTYGMGFCFLIGGSSEPEAEACLASDGDMAGGGACAYIGVGYAWYD